MNSVCESQDPPKDRKLVEAESNCAVATPGGEQLKAKGWSQTGKKKVNSIRLQLVVSLLGKGEACRGKRRPCDGAGPVKAGRKGELGWVEWERTEGFMAEDRRAAQETLCCVAVRALIVARKPGNAGGAKGRRKMKAR